MNAILAQVKQRGPFDGKDGEILAVVLVVMGIFLVIGLIVQICYLLSLSKALSRCSQENRTMEPGMVWLNLIPCFGTIWIFITVIRMSESLGNEFYERRMDERGNDYGKSLGITYNVLVLCGMIPYIGIIFSLAGLVCFIMYWVKIAGFSSQLASDRGGYDDDYDRPRKKKRQRDDYYDDDDDYDDGRR
jgi:hypothetical protein